MTDLKEKFFSGKIIVKNTIYNLGGYGIPVIVAIFLIPPLIKGLGEEKFGILNLVWIVIGYFSFLDFGIGKALTKIIAEKIGLSIHEEIPGVFWTSIFLMLFISILGTIVLFFSIPILVNDFFNISDELKPETLSAFFALAMVIPVITTTAGFRGVLEAYQKFKVINIFRIILGVFTFLIPLLCLFFTNSLLWIVISLAVIRVIIWFLYLLYCFRTNINIKKEFKFDSALITPVLKLSGWITVANLVGPLIIYSDRILIGGLISAAAITYYATPYEVVTKLFLIPGALVGVLFPVFSSSYISNPAFSKKLFSKGIKFVFLLLYPIIFLFVTFSYEGMELWLGQKFAEKSSLVLQFLSIGVLLNSISYIPFHFFQGIGKPDIPAKINLVELPIYIILMWLFIPEMGIIGAALVWLFRIILDTLILFLIADKTVNIIYKSKFNIFLVMLMLLLLIFPFFMSNLILKLIFSISTIISFLIISWRFFINTEEKIFFSSKLKFSETKILE